MPPIRKRIIQTKWNIWAIFVCFFVVQKKGGGRETHWTGWVRSNRYNLRSFLIEERMYEDGVFFLPSHQQTLTKDWFAFVAKFSKPQRNRKEQEPFFLCYVPMMCVSTDVPKMDNSRKLRGTAFRTPKKRTYYEEIISTDCFGLNPLPFFLLDNRMKTG